MKYRIKKTILVLILLAMGVFLFVQKDAFNVETDITASNDVNGTKDFPMEGDQYYEQILHGNGSKLLKLRLNFHTKDPKAAEGTIHVAIKSADGEVLGEGESNLNEMYKMVKTYALLFPMDFKMEKGKDYTLAIDVKGAKCEVPCSLIGMKEKGDVYGVLTQNGEEISYRLRMTLIMWVIHREEMVMSFLAVFLALIFVLLPLGKKDDKLNRILARIFWILSIPVAFFVLQRYADYNLKAFILKTAGRRWLINYFLFFLIWGLIHLICNRTKYTAAILVGITSFCGLANYFVWEFRGTPVMMADLFSIGTAQDVAGNYTYTFNWNALCALSVTVAFICMVVSLRSYKGMPWKFRAAWLALLTVPYAFFYTQMLHGKFFRNNHIELSVWEPNRNYASNGQVLSFLLSYMYSIPEKPSGYSVDKVKAITERYESDPEGWQGDVQPNIIVIMNETFSDLASNGTFETSEDYMPFIRNLTEDTVKGDLYVSVLGGNTANSEFEFLTGCSMAFLPFRSIPYDLFIKDSYPSLTSVLKESGYTGNLAFHPGRTTAWNRDKVYDYFGFDQIYFKNDMYNPRYLRTFISDESDFEFLLAKYEEDRAVNSEPFYAFNVTIQNHGGYDKIDEDFDTSIKILDDSLNNSKSEQYINLLKYTDDAFKNLIEYFKAVEEPTVVIFFGDHQPGFKSEYFNKIVGDDAQGIEATMRRYTVPYLMWANYDIEEENVNMSANYLSAYLMRKLGGNLTAYQKYILDLYDKLPVITANAYQGDDGVLHPINEKSEYSDLIEEYSYVEYNSLLDSEHRIESFYHLAGANQ